MINLKLPNQFQLFRFLQIMEIYGDDFYLIGSNQTINAIIEANPFSKASFLSPCECGQLFNDKNFCVCSPQDWQITKLNNLNLLNGYPRFIVIDKFSSGQIFDKLEYERCLEEDEIGDIYQKMAKFKSEVVWSDLFESLDPPFQKHIKLVIEKLKLPIHFVVKIMHVTKAISLVDKEDTISLKNFCEALNYFQTSNYEIKS